MLAAVYAAYYLGRDPYYLSLFYYILLVFVFSIYYDCEFIVHYPGDLLLDLTTYIWTRGSTRFAAILGKQRGPKDTNN